MDHRTHIEGSRSVSIRKSVPLDVLEVKNSTSVSKRKRKIKDITPVFWERTGGKDKVRRETEQVQLIPRSRFVEEPNTRNGFPDPCSSHASKSSGRSSKDRHVNGDSNNKLQDHPSSTLATSVSPSKTSSSLDDKSANSKIQFLQSYIATLKTQILYKDKKLHRLQRQSPKFSEDNKDVVLQSAWDQHYGMYSKFRILEGNEKSLNDQKESLEILVKELQAKVEQSDREKDATVKIIENLQHKVAEMQLLKLENETLKNHYEMEVQKKLKDYQKQCFDYVTESIRAYQIKLRTLQMLWQTHMGRQLDLSLLPVASVPGLCYQGNSIHCNTSENSTPPSAMTVQQELFDGRVFLKSAPGHI